MEDFGDFEQYKVSSSTLTIPDSIYYIPNFITEDEEEILTNKINDSSKIKWVGLSNRRLQNWGGVVHAKGLIAEPLPIWLSIYGNKVSRLGIFDGKSPNHVLINEYLAGQGIMPHEDGPAFYPTVATLSLGSYTVINYYPKNWIPSDRQQVADYMAEPGRTVYRPREPSFSLLLQPRSLVITSKEAYTSYLHGIDEVQKDTIDEKVVNLGSCTGVKVGDNLERTTRLSLTIRYVPKAIQARFLIGK
ncbi:alpha-ketoglutarate-dependent dioxygenase alkB homolog 6 [Tetranychus urticae]|nr:alpha-ketoglutarate-dependent dioxygenase alkB homolog 6 [Tetranychus urticae]